MSDAPDPPGGDQEQRELLVRLRAVAEAKGAEVSLPRVELAAGRELRKRLELQVAELQRRLGMDSTDSGTPLVAGTHRGDGASQGRAQEPPGVRAGAP